MHFTLRVGRAGFPGLSTHVNAFTIIAAACVLPLCLLRNYNKAQWSGILGNVALFVAVCRVVYASIYELADGSEVPSQPAHNVTMTLLGEAMRPDVQAFNQRTFSMFFGLMVFSFAIQCPTFGLEGDVKDKKDFLRTLDLGTVLAVLLYGFFGAVCYMANGNGNTPQIILHALPATTESDAVRVSFCVAILLLIPMQLAPCVEILDRWLLGSSGMDSRSLNSIVEADTVARSCCGRTMFENCIRIVALGIPLVLPQFLANYFQTSRTCWRRLFGVILSSFHQ